MCSCFFFFNEYSIYYFLFCSDTSITLMSQSIVNRNCLKKYSESFFLVYYFWATSKTWTRTLDPDPGPGPWTLHPDPGPWTWTLDPDHEKHGPWKTCTLKNLDPEKHGKQLDMEKWLEDHILKLINTENLLRRDL